VKPPFENRIWDPAETLTRDQLRELQSQRLALTLERVARVPFYQEALRAAKVTPDLVRGPDDVRRLPFTVKDDLRRNYPLGLLAVPRAEIARVHGSSGTTGKSTFVAYTRNDLETWSGLCARFLTAGGLLPEHLVHIAFGFGLFTGGFGLFGGVTKVGAGIVPLGGGNTPKQVDLIQDLQADVLICTPSYAAHIAEVAADRGLSPDQISLRFGHFGAEPWTEELRLELEKSLGILAFNNYGLSEVIGPGVAGECWARTGLHINEDHFIVECVDPETLAPVPDGELGELVFTSLTKEALPILRYRTRDLAVLDHGPCPCGRTGVRMSRVKGRSDDMLIIRGVNVFPSQVEEALLRIEATAPHYLIEVSRPGALDEVVVKVEVRPGDFKDEMRQMVELRDRIDREIHAVTGIRMTVELVAPNTLERSQGKAKRVIDHRKKQG
jgi:phenylacetate-CoA ligase